MNSANPQIVYYFGAGASFYAIPTVQSLQKAMQHFYSVIPLFHDKLGAIDNSFLEKYVSSDEVGRDDYSSIQKLYGDMHILGLGATTYQTIDTLAFTYFKNYGGDSYQFFQLKNLMNTFFTLWQVFPSHFKRKITPLLLGEPEIAHTWHSIDSRYISFVSSLLTIPSDDSLIPKNIKVVSWNYDLQFELAVNMFYPDESKLHTFGHKIGIIPGFNNTIHNTISHLNGISGYMSGAFMLSTTSVTDQRISDRDLKEIIEDVADRYVELNRLFHTNKDLALEYSFVSLAFENSELAVQSLAYATEAFEHADYIVVIGYSFPIFNRYIDLILFKKASQGATVIIQNPTFLKEDFNEIFPNFSNVLHKNHNQFYIPPDYWDPRNKDNWVDSFTL